MSSDARDLVTRARDIWIRRLIDPSRANSLLFYRELKVGTLDLTNQPQAVERLFAGKAVGVDDLCPQVPEGEAQADRGGTREGRAQDVKAALVALHRKALGNLEEKGIETLHLAVGMATWEADDGGRPYVAPVLLLPAHITTRGRSGLEVRLVDASEPELNPVLVHVLEHNRGIRLDADKILNACRSGSDERIDPECVFGRVQRKVVGVTGFKIQRRVVLANFQFAKMAMVEDLKKNGEALSDSLLIRAVAGDEDARRQLSADDGKKPPELDERPPQHDFLVLDADSTQLHAVLKACDGQSGVVQGPPGTGKSQTIANLIAQCVAEGRRVLFVAEKRAALDAVIKRLNHPDVGLGHLVLDLHGASVSRKEVLGQLANALDRIRHTPPVEADGLHLEFEQRRRQLNDHARRVNAPRPPAGMSVHRLLGGLLRLPEAAHTTLRLRGTSLLRLTTDSAAEVKRLVQAAAAHPTLVLGTDVSPWSGADLPNGEIAQSVLDLAGRAAKVYLPDFERQSNDLARGLGLRPPMSPSETNFLLDVLNEARKTSACCGASIFLEPLSDHLAALEPAGQGRVVSAWAFLTRKRYRGARRRLLQIKGAYASTNDLLEGVRQAADVLDRWQSLGSQASIPLPDIDDARLRAAWLTLRGAVKELSATLGDKALVETPFRDLASRLTALANDGRTPYLMPVVLTIRAGLKEAGLGPFVDELRSKSISPEVWVERFEYLWMASSLDQALSDEPALAAFTGRLHEQAIEAFVHMDSERLRLAAARVRRAHAERAIAAQNQHPDQAGLVRAEAAKKTRHLPLRTLLYRASDVLTSVMPCWVASPLSVSQLLDGGRRHFDLVVFDEASQVLPEEAVPALYRANQAVVAGDRHQLPPTTFFATAVDDGEDADNSGEGDSGSTVAAGETMGFESLLAVMESFLPNWLLEWHYRSEDERLISFSNHHVYSGRLVTFPSAHDREAVRHILVQHNPALGGQEESASAEVDAVVRHVLSHAELRPQDTLGVITMGIKHANRVQAALDRALDERPELSEFFSTGHVERFFVKNLETVQGDERDSIILSVGYGKSPNGDLPHRFGPLSQDAGYRRLNVAVTRARRDVTVISSFSHDEIDLKRAGGRGVLLLKSYLEFAASGGTRMPEGENPWGAELNPFEADIRDALEAAGIRTVPQYGASRYRIDLVALHPSRPGRPILAIECDGASYHSSTTARDRDRLRQEHLHRLGWRFHRIWSTDWFHSREKEIERAVAAFADAVSRADHEDGSRPHGGAVKPNAKAEFPRVTVVQVSKERAPSPIRTGRKSISQYSNRELIQLAGWVASDGVLRTNDEMMTAMVTALGFQRLGPVIRRRLLNALQSWPEAPGNRSAISG